ncbi:MAG: hypothetical protein ACLPKW_14835 [Acetobacteraceae bacterium]
MSVLKRVIRGIRDTVPFGHLAGRVSAGNGPVELIPFSDVAQAILKTGVIKSTAPPHDVLGFAAPGLFGASQQFPLAPAVAATLFPATGSSASSFTAGIAPRGNVVFYLVQNLPLFLAMGAPAGAIARMNCSAGDNIGLVTWLGSNILVPLGQILTMVMPASADAALGNVVCQFVGDPA